MVLLSFKKDSIFLKVALVFMDKLFQAPMLHNWLIDQFAIKQVRIALLYYFDLKFGDWNP